MLTMVEVLNTDEKENKVSIGGGALTVIIIIGLIWWIMGFIGFIWSLVCFGKSGSTAQKIVGLLMALFLGPFYFIYYFVDKTYCR